MLELEHGFHVVDVNTHLAPERGAVGPDQLERELRQAGIVEAIVSPPPTPTEELRPASSNATSGSPTQYLAANNAVARLSVDRPFVAFARITGSRPVAATRRNRLKSVLNGPMPGQTTPADIERYGYDDRFHGFALDVTLDGVPNEALVGALEAVGLPVIACLGGESPGVLPTALLERSVPVVLSPIGGNPLNPAHLHETIDCLDTYDHCYLETSGVRYRSVLERALLEHPDRVLFGSGTPSRHPNVAVMEVLTLDVTEDRFIRAFSKNADRVIEAVSTPW